MKTQTIKSLTSLAFSFLLSFSAKAASQSQATSQITNDVLIKLANSASFTATTSTLEQRGLKVEQLGNLWVRAHGPVKSDLTKSLQRDPNIEFVQPNYKVHLLTDYRLQDPLRRAALIKFLRKQPLAITEMPSDNPPIPRVPEQHKGDDPQFVKQWGMTDIGAPDAWKLGRGGADVVVAVIDTGVDYTHEDLLPNIWRNPGETGLDSQGRDKASNGVDDDKNGYVDDTIGWDFVSDDNKPFDLAVDPFQILIGGGNPGHGTHCAGNVAARGDNGIGVSGVAPNALIMPLRFISEKGSGTTADAIKAILYAVNNGAKVLSNSWGSEGEDSSEGDENKALRDTIAFAESKGVLFIAAAGNGHNGVGYDNDTDRLPGYPASYDNDSIISVAALDSKTERGPFSNWGLKSVDIGAPGVEVFSTVVGGGYSDVILDKFGYRITWDGTSMATPHVAGAAALYWSLHPQKTNLEVKEALLRSAKKVPSMAGKSVSEGKLDLKTMLENAR